MKAVVLAAGEGTRLRPLTFIRPKPLTPLGPEPSIFYLLTHLEKEGFRDIVVIVGGSQKTQIMDYLGDGSKFGVKITYAVKPEEFICGTAGSLRLAEHLLKEPFLVAQADTFSEIPLHQAVEYHKSSGAHATIVLTKVDDPSSFGVAVLGENGEILKFQEKPTLAEAESNLVSTGFYILEPAALDYIIDEKFDFAKDLFPRLLSLHKKVSGFVSEAIWVDIGTVEGYLEGVRYLLQQLTAEKALTEENNLGVGGELNRVIIDKGARIGHNVRISGPTLVESGVVIEDGASVGRFTLLKANSRISSGVQIEGSVVMENAVVGRSSEILESVIGESAKLREHVVVRHAIVGAGCNVESRTKLLEGSSTWPNAHVRAGEVVKGRVEVPLEKAFYFYKGFGQYTGVLTRSVDGMVDALRRVPTESIEFHVKNRDFERWARDIIGSNELADEFEKFRLDGVSGQTLRVASIAVARSFANEQARPESALDLGDVGGEEAIDKEEEVDLRAGEGREEEPPQGASMLSHMRSYMRLASELFQREYQIPVTYEDVSSIVIIGMGGSGIVGDIVKDMKEGQVDRPIYVGRRPDLPNFVNQRTLVFAVSYSGNTAETLAALDEAISRGCKIIGVTSGGKMKGIMEAHGYPVIELPQGYQPREALPFMLFPILKIFRQFGWSTEEVDIDELQELEQKLEEIAIELAPRLKGKTTLVYTEYPSVGRRLKSQLNENAKSAARFDLVTELFHNEVNAWKSFRNYHMILMRDNPEREDAHDLLELGKTLLDASYYTEVFAVGSNKSTRIMYMIWFGDILSYYLAKELGVDPFDIPVIEFIKSELSLRQNEVAQGDEKKLSPAVSPAQ